jgi:hypothetical protein
VVGIQHAAEMLLTGQVRRRVTGHGQSQRRRQSALAGWLAAVRLNPSRAGGGPAAWPLQVISGEEAALRGLVLRTADEPLAEALNLAGRIAEQAPLAVRATTRALRCALRYCATALLRCAGRPVCRPLCGPCVSSMPAAPRHAHARHVSWTKFTHSPRHDDGCPLSA